MKITFKGTLPDGDCCTTTDGTHCALFKEEIEAEEWDSPNYCILFEKELMYNERSRIKKCEECLKLKGRDICKLGLKG